MTVKTLSAGHPDVHYAATRQFYERAGFVGIEEFPVLWGESNPCLYMIREVTGSWRKHFQHQLYLVASCPGNSFYPALVFSRPSRIIEAVWRFPGLFCLTRNF